MKKKEIDIFGEVKPILDSLIDAVLNKELKEATVQQIRSIDTGMQIRNVQIPPHVIDTNNEDLNTSL